MAKNKDRKIKEESIDTEANKNAPVTLTIQDLTLCANIIDLSVSRGAFKGAEAETVGKMFSKLVAILGALVPPAEAGEEEKEK